MKELRLHGTAIVTGMGAVQHLRKLPLQRVFIVTGQGSVFKNGTMDKITAILEDLQVSYSIYKGIKKNPDTQAVLAGIAEMRAFEPDAVIAVGGGSAIDAAKVMTVFYENPALDFKAAEEGKLPEKRIKIQFVAIPTTSGTGTEVTRSAVITYRESNIKIGLKSAAFIPDLAILDGELTLTMPQNVAAETGMDAMTHAVESYINKNSDDFTECLALGAIKGLFEYLPSSCLKGDAESREKVHNFQAMAGCSFANVGLGMAHGISHAIGGLLDYGHGLLNAVALPYVLQYNSRDEAVAARLQKAAKRIDKEDFITAIQELNKSIGIPSTLAEMGMDKGTFEEHFELLTDNSLKGSTRVNPVAVSKEDMRMILRHMFEGKEIR